MFDFEDLEEKEDVAQPIEATSVEAPVAEATVGSSSQTLSSPPKEPPPPPPESPAPEPETIETPRVMSRPPGLASPQRELRAAKVVGNVLALDDQSQQHLLRHEELREVRDAAPPVPKIFGLACNTQFSCIADASGRNLEVMVVNANRSKISFAARICSCALKPDDRHLLVACEDATLSTYRLDPSTGNASTVLKLQFSAEDPPKEVAWHPINQKVFFTLHATRIRLWNLQLLHFTTMGQARNGVLVTPELLEASCGEAHLMDPKETLQHMSVSPSGRYVIAVSEKVFWRWSVREDQAIPEAFDVEMFDLEELDASQEIRYVETSPDRVLMVGEREVTDVLLFCGDSGTRIVKLVVTQHLKFQSPIRCQPKTPDAFLALSTASEPEGEVDLLLRAEKGNSITSLVACRLEQGVSTASDFPAVSLDNSGIAPPGAEPSGLEAGYPPGLPMPRYSRPPGLPSPPNRMMQEPPGLSNPMVSFDVPPGLALGADPQADMVGTSQPSQPSQSSARSEKDTSEAAARRTVESSDDLSGAGKQAAPPTESTATARELSHFMQKRADRASDQVVDQVLQRLPEGTNSGKPARKIMNECRQIEEQAQRTQRQVLKVLERPRPPSRPDPAALKTRCSEAVHSAADSASFPQHLGQHLADEPRAEVIRQHLRPSKDKITQVLQGERHKEVKSSFAKLPTRQALEGFMAEVSSQSMQEMKRLLAEVQTEGLQTSITDACRESVRATLRREVQALEAEVKSQSKQVTRGSGSTKDALMRRLGQKALPLHTELDQIDKELHAAGELLAKRSRGQDGHS